MVSVIRPVCSTLQPEEKSRMEIPAAFNTKHCTELQLDGVIELDTFDFTELLDCLFNLKNRGSAIISGLKADMEIGRSWHNHGTAMISLSLKSTLYKEEAIKLATSHCQTKQIKDCPYNLSP